jgi:hypothetical protein
MALAERRDHLPVCPAATVAGAACICERLENIQIETASRPTAAELIRRAKSRGSITGTVFAYEGEEIHS